MMGHVTNTTNSLRTLPFRRWDNPLDTDMGPTAVDAADRTTPHHRPITPNATVLQKSMTTTAMVSRTHQTRGNPESIARQDHPGRVEDVCRANQLSISLVSLFGSLSHCPSLYSTSVTVSYVSEFLMTILYFARRRPSRERPRLLYSS